MWLFFQREGASCKLLDLFLVSNPNVVGDFHQIADDIDRDGLFGTAASLKWSAVWFMAGVNEKVECFYTMLNFLLDTFVPVRRIKITEGDRLCSVRN
jgi:hypothetical protein